MLQKITHQTDLPYSDFISESVMELRVAPRQEQDQHRLSFDLALGPPASVNSYFDWLGNTVHAFNVNEFHNRIQIVATSVVETDRSNLAVDGRPDVWPLTLAGDYTLYDYLTFGGPVVECPALRETVSQINPQSGMSLAELAWKMLNKIDSDFEYKKGITTAASPITDVLEKRAGVCQDFTHLMIGMCREMKIPARYVSGLVHPDAERFRGYTQTHAWVEMLFPSTGWIGVDPTNKCIVGENFVKVATGRDYRDVPPNKGIYRGKATETIDVQVHTEKLAQVPPELAAEKYRSLQIPSHREKQLSPRDMTISQQQEQQQQAKRDEATKRQSDEG
jgi:transglutaminase-like putative cysteine protease